MIPRLGDGNFILTATSSGILESSLEIDSPSRGRKRKVADTVKNAVGRLEIDSPSRGRKRSSPTLSSLADTGLEIDSPSRGRKL